MIEIRVGDDLIAGYAFPATAIVQSEQALEKLRKAMAQAFGLLPIGIATFDTNRKLSTFNPALGEILNLDSVWLAMRPTIREFTEKLRANQLVPELRDFQEWRNLRQELEGVGDGSKFCQEWTLANSRTLRVTARSQEQGAVTLMIEDVTAGVNSRRSLQNALEVSSFVANRLAEGIAILDASGKLKHSNTALFDIWAGVDFDESDEITLNDLTRRWSSVCLPSPFWGDLRSFVSGDEPRESWQSDVLRNDGAKIFCSVSLLPDGCTLVLFSEQPPLAPAAAGFAKAGPETVELTSSRL